MKKRVVILVLAMAVATGCTTGTAVTEPGSSEEVISVVAGEEQTGEVVSGEEQAGEVSGSGAGEKTEQADSEKTEEVKAELVEEDAPKAYRVDFEHFYEGESEKSTIIVSNADGEVWRYEASIDGIAQVDALSMVGETETNVYFLENGVVKNFDLATGELVWENADFGGCLGASLITDDGRVFLSGYFGPFYQVIASDGQTIYRCASADEEDLYWSYEMEFVNEGIRLYCESNEDAIIIINTDDYSYTVE